MNHRDVYVGLSIQHQPLLAAQQSICERFGLIPRAELHITLGFLGEVPDRSLLALAQTLSPLTEQAPTTLSIEGAGGLYKGARGLSSLVDATPMQDLTTAPRVLWWTLTDASLYRYRRALEEALSTLGISEQFLVKPFSPHITIGSFSGSHKPWDVYAFEKKTTLSLPSPAEAIIEKFHITKTELHPQSLYVISEPNAPRGVVVWFTGWPASGKSTIARLIRKRLLLLGRESVLLDSDEVRSSVFPNLGYSDADRERFYDHLSSMAALLARQGSIVLVPATANKRELREKARSKAHAFIEVYTMASREESSARDPKRLYQEQKIDFVYEPPLQPEIQINGTGDTTSIEDLLHILRRHVI
jgi:adenylylsulfate kinase